MVTTSHALVAGALVATFPNNPALGLSLSFFSHPVMDTIPHWDFCYNWRQKSKIKLFIECSLDLIIGVFLAYLLFGSRVNFQYFLGAMLAVTIWDFLEAPYWFLKKKVIPFTWIYALQSSIHHKTSLPLGIITQVITVTTVIFLLPSLT